MNWKRNCEFVCVIISGKVIKSLFNSYLYFLLRNMAYNYWRPRSLKYYEGSELSPFYGMVVDLGPQMSTTSNIIHIWSTQTACDVTKTHPKKWPAKKFPKWEYSPKAKKFPAQTQISPNVETLPLAAIWKIPQTYRSVKNLHTNQVNYCIKNLVLYCLQTELLQKKMFKFSFLWFLMKWIVILKWFFTKCLVKVTLTNFLIS